MDLLQQFAVPWLFSRTPLSNLNIFLKCMRLVQHVSCNNSAPAAAVNAGIAQDPARGAEAGAGGCGHRGPPVPQEPQGCSSPVPSCSARCDRVRAHSPDVGSRGEFGVLVNHAGALEESCR